MGILNYFKRSTPPAAPAPARTEPTLRMHRHPRMTRGMFDGATNDRTTASWTTTPMTADQVIARNQRTLVARSRDQAQNNDYAKSFIRKCRQNIVGPFGPQLQAQVTRANGALDKEINAAIEAGWFTWGRAENCDVTGKRSWARIVQGCVGTAAVDGEFMVRMVRGKDAGPWGFALQTVDPQRCPVDMNEPARADGSFVRSGIRFNRYGRPLGYYFTALTQSDENYWYGDKAYTYVPAAEIIHGFVEDLEGQKRGLPWMATGLYRMNHLNGFENAVIVNARVAAGKMGFIKYETGFGPDFDDDEVPEFQAEAGVFEHLPEGASLEKWEPQFPSADVGPFVKHLLRGAAAGFGVPYNDLANDLEGVNFSSIRQGTLDSREYWKELQEWIIETLCVRVFEEWLPLAVLAGKIVAKGRPLNPAKVDKYMPAKWQPRRWDWIDPNADTKSAVDRKNNFLTSPSAIISEQGRDPNEVWAETARDMRAQVDALVAEGFDKAKAEELVMLSMGMQPPKPAPEPKAKNEPTPAE